MSCTWARNKLPFRQQRGKDVSGRWLRSQMGWLAPWRCLTQFPEATQRTAERCASVKCPKLAFVPLVVFIGHYSKMNVSFKVLNKTCDASFLNRGGTELEIGRKQCQRPTKFMSGRKEEEEGGKEGEGNPGWLLCGPSKLRVLESWKIRKCISSLFPDTCSCQGCYLLWHCWGSRGRPPGTQSGFQVPQTASSHPLGQKRMWNPASPSCLETELSGKVLRKGLKTCPPQQV